MAKITEAFINTYKSNIEQLSQQMGSRLQDACRVESVSGEYAYFDQLDATSAYEVTTRNADTQNTEMSHERRQVSLRHFTHAPLIDDFDKLMLAADPTSAYVKSAVNAFGRSKDDLLIEAAFGTAKTGHAGGTSTTFPASQQIAAGAAGLTLAKIIAARELFMFNEVDPDDELCIVYHSNQLSDLLLEEKLTSSDYQTIKALQSGEFDGTYMGFKWINSQRLPVNGSNQRRVLAFAKSGLLLAVGKDIQTQITERADKNYSVQVFTKMYIGATRMEEVKVVEIPCVES